MNTLLIGAQALPQKSFCLIRHGETTANRDQIIAGRLDVALTDQGRAQAQALQDRNWPAMLALFASPMQRAQESCRLGFPGQNFDLHPDLRERDWGVFEGRPLSQLPAREGCPEAGEDWGEMICRVSLAISFCCAQAGPRLPVMVCHSGVIRAARVLSGANGSGERPANAAPILFDWDGEHHSELGYVS
ncbi:histidine phosphatase family protein [Pseudophaeobacter sp.]|uniref:histidine phosphatase family protein n=1 Tax=Pseudophaeobacter sp. TaxID=1971739 RepID=UPI003297A54C